MTFWNKIVLAFKAGVLRDYEGALSYLLEKVLNPLLKRDKVAANVTRAVEILEKVIALTYRYEKYIPVCFVERFNALRDAIESLIDALDDGVLEEHELEEIFKRVRAAKSAFVSG